MPQRLRINNEGLVEGVRFIPSPNCDERPAACAIHLLVIHYISLPPGAFGGTGIIEHFTNRLDPSAHPFYASIAGVKVSAHFLIRRDGGLIQFVPCAKRAWHAGKSSWKGKTRCNDFSIGIEMEGTGEVPFTAAQYRRLATLTRVLQARYPIISSALKKRPYSKRWRKLDITVLLPQDSSGSHFVRCVTAWTSWVSRTISIQKAERMPRVQPK